MSFGANRYWRLLAVYLAPRRGQLALLALLIFGGIGLQLVSPQIMRFFLDTATGNGATGALLGAAGLYIGVALAQRAASFGAVYMGENLGWWATNNLRADLARHVIGLDLGFHKVHTPGELIERLDGDVTALANFFSQFSVRVVGNALLIGGVLVILWIEDWRIGLGLSVYAALTLGILALVQRLGVRRWRQAREDQAQVQGFLEERLGASEDLRASGAEKHTLGRFDGLMQRSMHSQRAARLAGNVTYASTTFLANAGYAAGLALGAALYLGGSVTIGSAFLIVNYVGMLSAPLDRIREQIQDLQQAGASIDRVGALFAEQPLVREQVSAQLPAGPLGVTFDAVTFAYEDAEPLGTGEARGRSQQASALEQGQREASGTGNDPAPGLQPPASGPVLQDVSFALEPGQTLGLLGRTGSGKTTSTRLIFRLYDPQGGAIRLGGHDLRTLALDDLRSRVGIVTQEVQLFQATVRENLTLFDETIGDEQIKMALEELGLWDWAQALPQGLATKLGGEQGLSAGEAQLLAFARVFLRNPGLLILDEASSRLDPATERLLERAIDRLLAERSAIIIAHRLSTVERADLIAILDEGRVVEFGPREALAADPSSRFARLLRTGIEEVLA